MRFSTTILFCILAGALGQAQGSEPDPLRLAFKHADPALSRAAQLAGAWDVQSYVHDLDVDPPARMLSATTTLTARALVAAPGPLLVHASGPELIAVRVDGEDVDWTVEGDQVWVDPPATVAPGDDVEFEVDYTSAGNTEWEAGFNWGPTAFNFNEPEGARRWLVVYDDPSDKATLTWNVTAPTGPSVVANGTLTSQVDNGDGTTSWTWEFSEPIATYLMVLYIGGLERADDTSGRVPVYTWASPALLDVCAAAFSTTPDMIEVFSELWGDYPWDHYSNVVVPFFGAMENTTATTFAEDIAQGDRAEIVNAHELAHHWWGDWVTLEGWSMIWLNEGFASYAEDLWTEATYGEEARQTYLSEQRASYLAWREREGTFPLGAPEYLWGGTVYDKGAFVLHMLRRELGDEAFFGGMRAYGEAHAYANASTDDFQSAMEDVSGQDLSWFFTQWVEQTGEPSFQIEVDQRALEEGGVQADLSVIQVADGSWVVPLTLGLTLADGTSTTLSGEVGDDEVVWSTCLSAEITAVTVDPEVDLLYNTAAVLDVDEHAAPLVCGVDGAGQDTGGEAPKGGTCGCASEERVGGGWLIVGVAFGLCWRRRWTVKERQVQV